MSPEQIIHPEEQPPTDQAFWLWREDIHGNQYRMDLRFDTQEEAEQELEKFASRGHKQTYSVKPSSPNDITFIPASE